MEENKQYEQLVQISLEDVKIRNFESEKDLQDIIQLIEKELSEPYPIYTYRYFVQKWPDHTFLAFYKDECIGCIVAKLEDHEKHFPQYAKKKRGYIAMLAVQPPFRRCGLGNIIIINFAIGRKLVRLCIDRMKEQEANEVVLETELINQKALNLYECNQILSIIVLAFGFIRDKRLASYYLNGNDAFKLKLFITS